MQSSPNVVRSELLYVADAVAREKSIDRDQVLEAMELAIQKAGKAKYGHEHDIRADIDRKTGDIRLARYRKVVEEIEDEMTEILLKDAKHFDKEVEIDGYIIEPLPPIDFGRIAAQTAKQVIIQKVREAERERQYEEFKDKVGEITSGVVKRVDYGGMVLDLGRSDAFLPKDQLILKETMKNGDRVRAYIKDVKRDNKAHQIILSRTAPEFMAMLFMQEVPEIYDNVVQIKSVARDPGSRAKIAVTANDSSIDPVGCCVGMRGSRVQAVVNELQGEKVDIIEWSEDLVTFVVNALAPAEVSKVIVDEDKGKIEVVVPEENLSLAIGRRGQNVRLASELTSLDIDIMTEDQESSRRQDEFKNKSQTFIDALNIDDVIGHLLVAEGFTSVEEIAEVDLSELAAVEGFDEDIAAELINRAKEWLSNQTDELEEKMKSLGIDSAMFEVDGLTEKDIVELAEKGVKTLDDLADLATDELLEMLPNGQLEKAQAEEIIMKARSHWFEEEAETKKDSE